MQSDAALLSEIWGIVKSHVSAKEKLHVADALVELFDEYGMADGLEGETDLDKTLKISVASYFGIDDEEDEDE